MAEGDPMKTRETFIDGRVFLEIVRDEPAPKPSTWEAPADEDSSNDNDGVWIGELVPYAD